MPEYIKRTDALRIIDEVHGARSAYNRVRNIPAEDVATVRHGRLISTGYDEQYCEFGNCTVCGGDNPMHNRFCGFCGAKMDLEG